MGAPQHWPGSWLLAAGCSGLSEEPHAHVSGYGLAHRWLPGRLEMLCDVAAQQCSCMFACVGGSPCSAPGGVPTYGTSSLKDCALQHETCTAALCTCNHRSRCGRQRGRDGLCYGSPHALRRLGGAVDRRCRWHLQEP